jgi:hypothetical protein
MNVPFWLLFLGLYIIVVGVLLPIRQFQEGLPYNVSFASEYGDLALILIIMIGAEVLQRTGASGMMGTLQFHVVVGVIALLVGFVWQCITSSGAQSRDVFVFPAGMFNPFYLPGMVLEYILNGGVTLADSFHNMIGVPVLIYFLTTTILPTFRSATWFEMGSMFSLVMIWTLLVWYDARHGRLQQTKWLTCPTNHKSLVHVFSVMLTHYNPPLRVDFLLHVNNPVDKQGVLVV